MNYIVFDIESTCWGKEDGQHNRRSNSEIIEIGAVKLNEKLEELGTFQTFIQPTKHPNLSAFCRQLTNIKQWDVDEAPTFDDVIDDFRDFVGDDYKLVAWGDYDKRQLAEDCSRHKIDREWTSSYFNLKEHFKNITQASNDGLAGALWFLGLETLGTPHRAICDAINTVQVLRKLFPDPAVLAGLWLYENEDAVDTAVRESVGQQSHILVQLNEEAIRPAGGKLFLV